MINYKEKINSGKSLAGFELGKNINKYLGDLYYNHIIIETKIFNEDKKNEVHHYFIDNHLKINTLKNGEILNISCIDKYYGKYNELLYLGIKVKELKDNTSAQSIMNGGLFVNKDFGFCFMLQHPYDEIADSINNLPDSLILNEICVGDFTWWFRPEFTPDYAKP